MREAILIFSFGILSFLSLCFGGGAKASMCLCGTLVPWYCVLRRLLLLLNFVVSR
jgi:hypothetical protein